MSKLTRILTPAILAATGLGLALPAQAADYGRHDSRYDSRYEGARHTPARNAEVRFDVAQLRRDIDRAAQRRTISPREASGLRRDTAELQRQWSVLSRNGLTRAEARMLDTRADRIRFSLRQERRDSDNRRG